MPEDLSFGAAIIVGLLGSTHCLGMCGGIVSAFNVGVSGDLSGRPKSLFAMQLAYNTGRICSYVIVGFAAGALGAGLAQLGVSPIAGKLFAAAFMIALGLYLADWWRGLAWLEKLGGRLWRHIQPLGQRLFPIESPLKAFFLGTLWGWLPCGLVYAVVAWSLTTANAGDAALIMLGFGLGTLPSMLLAGNAFNYLKSRVQTRAIRNWAGILIIAFGLYNGFSIFSHQAHHHGHADSSPTTLQQSGAVEHTRVPAILLKAA